MSVPSRDGLEWAAETIRSIEEGTDPPDPPESVEERRRERRRARKARRARNRAIAEGIVEDVPVDERCIGAGPFCAVCGEALPEPGDPPQRCRELGGDGQ